MKLGTCKYLEGTGKPEGRAQTQPIPVQINIFMLSESTRPQEI